MLCFAYLDLQAKHDGFACLTFSSCSVKASLCRQVFVSPHCLATKLNTSNHNTNAVLRNNCRGIILLKSKKEVFSSNVFEIRQSYS